MLQSTFSAVDVSASGLAAERYRMEVIANNIANANTTRTPEGGPYRRQQVIFATAFDNSLAAAGNESRTAGVQVLGVESDLSEFQRLSMPEHPDADADGYVLMPNVKIPHEMVDMITASRAYEANLQSIKSFRQMARATLTLLRGHG